MSSSTISACAPFLSEDDRRDLELACAPADLTDSLLENLIFLGNGKTRLITAEEGRVVTGIEDSAGALLTLTERVDTSARPAVEWLPDVYAALKATLKAQLAAALAEPHLAWVDLFAAYPLQIGVLIQQLEFTRRVETGLAAGSMQSGSTAPLMAVLQSLQEKVRQGAARARSQLPALERTKVGAGLTILIGQIHQVEALLAAGAAHFEDAWAAWRKMVRHYRGEDGVVVVQCGDTEVEYGWQFLGTRPTLVRTPLTFQAYHAAFQAMERNGLLTVTGPPGTGKLETMSDLARFELGRPLLVLSGPTLDPRWLEASPALFAQHPDLVVVVDEVNRAPPEVIERVWALWQDAALPAGSFRAFTYHPKNGDACDGMQRAHTSTISLTVPDHRRISEVILAVEGFMDSAALCAPIVDLFQWCRDTLTPQPHYDFGLRALRSLLLAAGKILRAHPHTPEPAILRAAWDTAVLPRFTPADLSPALTELHRRFGAPDPALELLISPDLLAAEPRLARTSQLRHGLAVLAEDTRRGVEAVERTAAALGARVLPVRYTEPGVFGADGAFVKALRAAQEEATWVVLTAPRRAPGAAEESGVSLEQDMQDIYSLLDDNKVYRVEGAEAVPLSHAASRVVFVVEPAVVGTWSPALVSRLGAVFLPPLPDTSGLGSTFDAILAEVAPKMDRLERALAAGDATLATQAHQDLARAIPALEHSLTAVRACGENVTAWLHSHKIARPAPAAAEEDWEVLGAGGDTVTVKVDCQGEIRRWSMPRAEFTWAGLRAALSARNLSSPGEPVGRARMSYRDEDGDAITLMSEEDFREMLQHTPGPKYGITIAP